MKKEKKNKEMPSKYETLKTSLLLSSCVATPLPETGHFTFDDVLLLCEIMKRGASYLYCFPFQNLTGADFTWGSKIILF